jgi:DNA polymerase III subunit beta
MQEFEIRAGELLRLFKAAASVVERRNTVPIIGQVMVQVRAAILVVGTNPDMELDVFGEVVSRNTEEIAFCVSPFPVITVLASAAADAIVTVRQADGRATFKWPGGSFSLYTLPAADFPRMPVHGIRGTVALTADFIAALRRVTPCISKEETRYYLNGVYLERQASTGTLAPVATDGHRLAAVVTKTEVDKDWPAEIIPRRVCELWPRLFPGEHTLSMREGKQIVIANRDMILTAKVIDGSFPEWRRVVPKQGNRKFVTGRHALGAAATIAGKLSGTRSRGIAISAAADGASVRGYVRVNNPDVGELLLDLGPVAAPADFALGINARYLAQALQVVKGDMVALEAADAQSPLTVRGDEDADGLFVLMPLRI